MTRNRTLAALFGAALALAGCGVTYVSPSVQTQSAGVDVRVVPVTRETTLLANRAPYTPRSLPAYLRQGAGGGSLRGTGALPPRPETPDLTPGQLDLRFRRHGDG